MVRGCGLYLISTLHSYAALSFAYDGPYQGRGPRRTYGDKLEVKALPTHALRQRTVEHGLETCLYQGAVPNKEFPQPLHVVVIVKTNLAT